MNNSILAIRKSLADNKEDVMVKYYLIQTIINSISYQSWFNHLAIINALVHIYIKIISIIHYKLLVYRLYH